MKDQLIELLKFICAELGFDDIEPEVQVSDNPAHGDYTTNVALRLAASKQFNNETKLELKSPMDFALQVKEFVDRYLAAIGRGGQDHTTRQITQSSPINQRFLGVLQVIERVEIAAPGFINFFLLASCLSRQLSQVLKEGEGYGMTNKQIKKIMVEFAHPNTHKAFHIGHLRNIATGEAIVRLLESQGTQVVRANYQGDVGMHIAKTLYALLRISKIKDQISKIRSQDISKKVEFVGQAYAAGSKAYDEDETAKKEIAEINKMIYAKDPKVYSLYQETRQWSLDYFAAIYQRVGSHFDRYYFESEVYESGKANTLKGLEQEIFVESEGAIIFPGRKFGLHNRVFITGEGNATYEGKDMGLGPLQFAEYQPDMVIHVVGPEQAGYFQVIFEALAQLFPQTRGKEYHLIYGWVKLKHGKMSSRSGNVVLGEWLLDQAKQAISKILEKNKSNYTEIEKSDIAEKAAVAAVKYAFLKVSTKREIAFDLKESVSFEGDSGPYLQYTYTRAKSVLRKAKISQIRQISPISQMNTEERAVARFIAYFPEIVAEAARNYAPNLLCSYLFQLAQTFNLFYAKHTIVGKESSVEPESRKLVQGSFRLALTAATAQVLKNGLYLLGIEVLEQM